MPRTLTSGMQTAVTAEVGTIVHFLEFEFAEGTVRFTTAVGDISWNGFTWTACGGAVGFEAVQESGDLSAAGVAVSLSGVDRTLVALALTQQYLGRNVTVWFAHLDPVQQTIIQNPIPLFLGYMNGQWSISETHSDADGSGTVDMSLQCVDRLGRLDLVKGIETNPDSLQAFFPGDLFFAYVADLSSRQLRWGQRGIVVQRGPSPGGPVTPAGY